MAGDAPSAAAAVARASYGRLIAFLAARSHDIAAAEDALSDAFAAALAHWPQDGVPDVPEAWLLTAARRRLHDAWRRGRVAAGAEDTLRLVFSDLATPADGDAFPDERLKLMFVCSHPAIDPAARPALMLQVVLGLDAARIASAFLLSPAALSQRLVRAKTKIRSAGMTFEVPSPEEWTARLGDVLEAIYAAYGTAWDDVAGTDPQRSGLAAESIDLASTLVGLLPGSAEAWGLLSLMAFCHARAGARRDSEGEYVPLDRQDPAGWDRELHRLAESALHRAAALASPGPFQLEAAIQSAHTQRRLGAAVPPGAVVQLYDALLALRPSVGACVSRCCALARAEGAAAGLAALDALASSNTPDTRRLASYQPYWAARAHLLTEAGRGAEARTAFQRAIGLATQSAVRAHLTRLAGALN